MWCPPCTAPYQPILLPWDLASRRGCRAFLMPKIAPGCTEQCPEGTQWGWVRLLSIISVSSLDFGNRVAVVLQEIL